MIATNASIEPVAMDGLGLPSLPLGKIMEGLVVRDRWLVLLHLCH